MTDRLFNSPEEMKNGVIVTRTIRDLNVTEDKIAADAVTRNKIPKGFLVNWISPPSSPMVNNATGEVGDCCYSAPYLYICVLANIWVRTEMEITW